MDPPLHSGVKSAESYPKRPKMQISAGKVLASVFWDGQGILYIDYLEKQRTIKSKCYIASLMRLKERNHHKTATNGEEKGALSLKQCNVSQVDHNDGKTT